jgi:hypothetical protein
MLSLCNKFQNSAQNERCSLFSCIQHNFTITRQMGRENNVKAENSRTKTTQTEKKTGRQHRSLHITEMMKETAEQINVATELG